MTSTDQGSGPVVQALAEVLPNLKPGPIEVVAAFLKLRDETVPDPDERTDEEREESARMIVDMIAPRPATLIEAVPLIVAAMVKARHPVEAINKADHRRDHIPVEQFGKWSDKPCHALDMTFAELNFGMALVGGWHSKSALARLIVEVWRAARAGRA